MPCLIPHGWLPVEWQPLVTLICSWSIMRFILASVEPAFYRPYMLRIAFGLFVAYWTLFVTGADFGGFSPFFGPDGIGEEALFATLLMIVGHSLSVVENDHFRRLVYVARLDLTYSKDGVRLSRRPSLAETSGLYKPDHLAE